MSESLFSIKKRNNNKWVCMWVLHAIVLLCTGVSKTFVARSPISKKTSRPAARTRYHQPHPKRLYSLIQVHVWGRRGEGPGSLPQWQQPSLVVNYSRVSCWWILRAKKPSRPEDEGFSAELDSGSQTLVTKRGPSVCRIHGSLLSQTPSGCRV